MKHLDECCLTTDTYRRLYKSKDFRPKKHIGWFSSNRQKQIDKLRVYENTEITECFRYRTYTSEKVQDGGLGWSDLKSRMKVSDCFL